MPVVKWGKTAGTIHAAFDETIESAMEESTGRGGMIMAIAGNYYSVIPKLADMHTERRLISGL